MKNKFNIQHRLILFASILAFVTTRCNTSHTEIKTPFDLANAKNEIQTENQNFSNLLSKGDSVGLANCYASDAKLMGPNGPAVMGRQNIQTVFASYIKAGVTKADLKAIDVWGTDELLTEEGELTIATKDGAQVDKGKYVVVWKKEEGKWKIFRDIFNSDLPVPTPK
jgi:ketosteroid isomerase-like protein